MIRQPSSKLGALLRSLALLALLVFGVPTLLIVAALERFGGGAPLHGVASPVDWDADRIKSALTDRLTDHTVADVVIRLSLMIAWVAVVVLVITVIAEVVHMLRHDGMALPHIRGLGLPQSVARVIATGLLVVVPMFGSPPRAVARDGGLLVPQRRSTAVLDVELPSAFPSGRPERAGVIRPAPDRAADVGPPVGDVAPTPVAESGEYLVRSGDSVYAIAERLAGPDRSAVLEFAERLIELNFGNEMPDGQRFTNAAFIDVGWVLQLPTSSPAPEPVTDVSGVHIVARGESLWSIAEDHLDDGGRWPEIFEANRGRSFDDGRELVDPDLIQPGWQLDVPGTDRNASVATGSILDDPQQVAAQPDNVWVPADSGVIAPDEAPQDASESGSSVAAASIEVGSPGSSTSDDDVRGRTTTPESPVPPPSTGVDQSVDAPAESEQVQSDQVQSDEVELLTFTRAAMLSAGVLTLLGVRRRSQLRRARPRARLPEPAERPAATERALRATDTGARFGRIDVAVRSAARSLIEQGERVLAALVTVEGDVELRLSGAVHLPSPWRGAVDRWQIDGTTPLELLVEDADRLASPCPTMIQVGRDLDGRDVYVDLEGCEAIEVGGPADQADAIVAAVAMTLAGSASAEVTALIGLGVPGEAFLGHRHYAPVIDSQSAFEAAAEAVGSTSSAPSSTFEMRVRGVAGELWEPAVVLVGSAVGRIVPPSVRTGVAVVSASPIDGPSIRLAPDGDAWALAPLDLRLVPIGLTPDDLEAIANLVEIGDPVSEEMPAPVPDPDDTIVDPDASSGPDRDEKIAPVVDVAGIVVGPTPEWRLMVRLLGQVEVVSRDGDTAKFERSKTRELVAWLATHRTRSTRTSARTALWELDVRDATFANVVSEARRSLARLVVPPPGEEWVGRTMTEALPLHPLVCTDADLVERALDTARLQPPAQAIATLSPAVELINGMPFEGTSYLWSDPEGIASNLVLLATSAAAELAAHCLSIGDIAGVFRATGRGLMVLPGHEELIGLRMQAHAGAGDHAGVRQEWESYERVITSEPWSDGEPSPKLVELRRQLLNPSH